MERLNNGKILTICSILLGVIICCFSGCRTNPPSRDRIKNLFTMYETDFRTVSVYLARLPAEQVSINMDTMKMNVDFTVQTTDGLPISTALQHLREAGCSSIYMNREDNSIGFVLWKTGWIGDAEAGILYEIDTDKDTSPTKQYLTELQPLQGNVWYYYVADYEVWRNNRKS